MSTITTLGKYTVREGDSATTIAERILGDRSKVATILNANPEATYTPGDIINVPGFLGITVTVANDDQFPSLFRRIYKNPAQMQAAKVEFMKWNGTTMVENGDEVFFVDLRSKSYGY